jgi:hypothetical protein
MTKDELETMIKEQKEFFANFIKQHTGELMLDSFEVVRFEGVIDEDEYDYYWRLLSPTRGIYRTSCVMTPILLKEVLPEQDYNHLESVFNINLPFFSHDTPATEH